MRSPVVSGALALALVSGSPARSADPAPPSPEQAVLDRYLGNWTTTYRVGKAEWTPAEKTGSATVTVERVLGGAYLQEKSVRADGTTGLSLRTFDAERKGYRAWWFSSAGQSSESGGTWDAAGKTFTWTATHPDFTTTARHRFTGDDTFEWSVVVNKVGTGTVLYQMEGKSVRVRAVKQ